MSDDEQTVDDFEDFEVVDTDEQPVVGYVVLERTTDHGDRYAEIMAVAQAPHSPVAGPWARDTDPDGWGPKIELDEDDQVVGAFPASGDVTRLMEFYTDGFGRSSFSIGGEGTNDQEDETNG